MIATNLESRRNADGSIDLRFSTDTAIQTVTLAPEAAHLLLACALMSGPEIMPLHDGFALGETGEGKPALMFRFGTERWLSILLGPLDLETLEEILPRR
jgi:hypothetical protein